MIMNVRRKKSTNRHENAKCAMQIETNQNTTQRIVLMIKNSPIKNLSSGNLRFVVYKSHLFCFLFFSPHSLRIVSFFLWLEYANHTHSRNFTNHFSYMERVRKIKEVIMRAIKMPHVHLLGWSVVVWIVCNRQLINSIRNYCSLCMRKRAQHVKKELVLNYLEVKRNDCDV